MPTVVPTIGLIARRRKRRLKNRLIRFTVCLLVLGMVFYLIFGWLKLQTGNLSKRVHSLSLNNQKGDLLKGTVEKVLEDTTGSYSVVVKNLKSGETFYQDEHKVYGSGSLYKLWVLATAFQQVEDGSLKLDEQLTAKVEDLNGKFNLASDEAELNEGEISLTASDAIAQMITISHNYSAMLVTERVKLSNVINFLDKNGFSESEFGSDNQPPTTTAFDIALFFEKLYKGELANQESTNQMLELLKKQQLNGKLPKYLPENIAIAHKTGELGWFSHDVGIVYAPKGDYIIVVLSQTEIPAAAEDRIAQLSKNVYDYFSD